MILNKKILLLLEAGKFISKPNILMLAVHVHLRRVSISKVLQAAVNLGRVRYWGEKEYI